MAKYRLVSDLIITDKKTGDKTYLQNVIPEPYGIKLKASKSLPKVLRAVSKMQKLCEEFAVDMLENDAFKKVYVYHNFHIQRRENWIDNI